MHLPTAPVAQAKRRCRRDVVGPSHPTHRSSRTPAAATPAGRWRDDRSTRRGMRPAAGGGSCCSSAYCQPARSVRREHIGDPRDAVAGDVAAVDRLPDEIAAGEPVGDDLAAVDPRARRSNRRASCSGYRGSRSAAGGPDGRQPPPFPSGDASGVPPTNQLADPAPGLAAAGRPERQCTTRDQESAIRHGTLTFISVSRTSSLASSGEGDGPLATSAQTSRPAQPGEVGSRLLLRRAA